MSADVLRPDDYLLRRVHRSQIRPGSDEPTRGAFTPNRNDTDGLSLYREDAVTPTELLMATGRPDEFIVLRISVAELSRQGLNVIQKEDESPQPLAGHCVIPELNYDDYQADKANDVRRWPQVQEELLRAASRAET